MQEPVEGVLFDLDGTLCEYCRSGDDILSIAFEEVGVEPAFTVDEYVAIFDEYAVKGRELPEIRKRCFEVLAAEAGYDPSVGHTVADVYDAERDQTNVQFLPGAREALDVLRERYPVAAVTNGDPATQSQKLSGLGIDDHFETVVYAGYDTAAKPDPEPFELALDALGVGPERAVTVGNSLDHDVAGAHNAGLRSVWLAQDGIADPEPEPHYRIEAMDELLEGPWR